jgi:hypothetical protein
MFKKTTIPFLALAVIAAAITPAFAQNRFMEEAKERQQRLEENKAIRDAEHPATPAKPAAPTETAAATPAAPTAPAAAQAETAAASAAPATTTTATAANPAPAPAR